MKKIIGCKVKLVIDNRVIEGEIVDSTYATPKDVAKVDDIVNGAVTTTSGSFSIAGRITKSGEEFLDKLTEDDECTCKTEVHEYHTCPFKEDINNDHKSMCTCCDSCTMQCAMDI